MGECIYYFVAESNNKEKLEQVKKYIEESQKAYNYWQNNRDKDKIEEFKQKFPIIFKNVGLKEWKNGYAGLLISATEKPIIKELFTGYYEL